MSPPMWQKLRHYASTRSPGYLQEAGRPGRACTTSASLSSDSGLAARSTLPESVRKVTAWYPYQAGISVLCH
jgi:hypothetical protein